MLPAAVTAETFVHHNALSSSVKKVLRMTRLCAEEGGQERQSKWPLEGVNNMFSNALKCCNRQGNVPFSG